MEITEVRIKLMEDSDDRLQAFCSITFDDCFVVRDLKIIEGTNGPFVAMPSRKLTAHCAQCGCKNHLRAIFCNQCGSRMVGERAPRDEDGRAKHYADIAHPINTHCREMIQNRVIAEYHAELELAKEPGYASRYDEDFAVEFERPGDPNLEATPPVTHSERLAPEPPGPGRGHVQPAEPQPRSPHIATGPQSTSRPPSGSAPRQARKDDFGAGIFER